MRLDGRLADGHLGNIPGDSSPMAYLPGDDLHLVVLINQNFTQTEQKKVNVEIIAEAILRSMAD